MGESRKTYSYRNVVAAVRKELALLKRWGLGDLVRVEESSGFGAKKQTKWLIAEKCVLCVRWERRYGISLRMELLAPPYEFKSLPAYMLTEPNLTSFVRKFLEKVVIYLTQHRVDLPCRAHGIVVGENALAEFTLGKDAWVWKVRVNGRSVAVTKSPLFENPVSAFAEKVYKAASLLFL